MNVLIKYITSIFLPCMLVAQISVTPLLNEDSLHCFLSGDIVEIGKVARIVSQDTFELGLSGESTVELSGFLGMDRIRADCIFYPSDSGDISIVSSLTTYLDEDTLWCVDGYFGHSGFLADTVFPGDTVFLYLKITASIGLSKIDFPWENESLIIFVHSRKGSTIYTGPIILKWNNYPFWMPTPESLQIANIDTIIHLQADHAASFYGGDFYRVYRDTIPIFYPAQLFGEGIDTAARYIGTTSTWEFTDNFSDTLWHDYIDSSRGIDDTLANLFYTFVVVDTGPSAPGDYMMGFPSVNVCEFDQPLHSDSIMGGRNWISIPCYDNRRTMASDLDSLGINSVMAWNPYAQVLEIVGLNYPGIGWVVDGSLQVGNVYYINCIHGYHPPIFTTNRPGIIPDYYSTQTLNFDETLGGRNIITIPFRAYIENDIHDRETLEESIFEASDGTACLTRIDRWNCDAFFWEYIAIRYPIYPSWLHNPHLRAGVPYRIWISSYLPSCSFVWPVRPESCWY